MTTGREEPHWDRCSGAYSNCPWLTPAWGMRAAMVALHVILVGGVFLLDGHLIEEARVRPWYIGLYLLLFILTIAQYFYTAGSSPGYVLDIMKDKNIAEIIMKRANDAISCSTSTMESQLIVHTNEGGYRLPTSYGDSRGKDPTRGLNASEIIQAAASSSSDSSCHYCHTWQPPRSKHCHDCDKCVLGFDHHCMWLGTCIGEGNHCKFWWYIFEETILGIWTSVLYITSFKKSGSDRWLHNLFVILLLIVLLIGLVFLLMLLFFHSYLALTNQTTYEAIRRRRIPYLRGLPDGVHPYSKGAFRNLYLFCCSRSDFYVIEFLPSIEELGTRAKPYAFWDILSCHC